jgi:hypothetical protein
MIPNQLRHTLPTFLCIGGQRCGSTWVHRVLEAHPEVALSSKEYNFFNLRIRTEGFEKYCSFFSSSDPSNLKFVRGDISPLYSAMFRDEVEMLHSMLPDLKIILIIRNPVDRLISSITRGWTFSFVDTNAPTSREIFTLLRQVDTNLQYRLTDYGSIYGLWVRHFGKDNLLIKTYDSLLSEPEQALDEVLNFIGVHDKTLLSNEVVSRKPNKSRFKDEIPPMLEWYLAKKWLPKVEALQHQIPHLDTHQWIDDLKKKKAKGRVSWHLIYLIHFCYFVLPYSTLYLIFNFFRIRFRVYRNDQVLKNLENLRSDFEMTLTP